MRKCVYGKKMGEYTYWSPGEVIGETRTHYCVMFV